MCDLYKSPLIHPEWSMILKNALETMSEEYLQQLNSSTDWLPSLDFLFAAFSCPLSSTRYILLGESPYPRVQSANGYAFWDAAVDSLWSSTGLSKAVNRATSLRNLIKMLLFTRGDLTDDFSQDAIARLDKSNHVQTVAQLFGAFIKQGFLLLNACLVYSEGQIPYHARHWQPFMRCLFSQLAECRPDIQLILFGRIAASFQDTMLLTGLIAEHPYNISFITNDKVNDFFRPMDLLSHDL